MMTDLAAKDLRSVIDVVYALHDGHGAVDLPSHVVVQLGDLVGCESSFYSGVEHATGRLLDTISEPIEADLRHLPGFHSAMSQHPGFAAYHSGRMVSGTPIALTDLADLPSLRRLALYVDYYRPHGTVDQLLCLVHRGRRQSAVLAFNRGRRGFSHRDRAVVELAAAHVSQAIAHREHLAALTSAVRRTGRQSEQLAQAGPWLPALTPRERQVVEHLVLGLADREIAHNLAISVRTVHKHLEVIYRKLDLDNRTSLIALVHQKREPPSEQRAVSLRQPA